VQAAFPADSAEAVDEAGAGSGLEGDSEASRGEALQMIKLIRSIRRLTEFGGMNGKNVVRRFGSPFMKTQRSSGQARQHSNRRSSRSILPEAVRLVGPAFGYNGRGLAQRRGCSMAVNFATMDRETPDLLPISVFYGDAMGAFRSPKPAPDTDDSIAFGVTRARTRTDHHPTIAAFNRRFIGDFALVLIAQSVGLVKCGAARLHGIKIEADVTKDVLLNFEYANGFDARQHARLKEFVHLTERAEIVPRTDSLEVPLELKRRKPRLAVIAAAAEAEIDASKDKPVKAEQPESGRESSARICRNPTSNPFKAPEPHPGSKDQINATDPEARIVLTAGGGFDRSDEVRVSADTETHLIMARHVTAHPNAIQEVDKTLSDLTRCARSSARSTRRCPTPAITAGRISTATWESALGSRPTSSTGASAAIRARRSGSPKPHGCPSQPHVKCASVQARRCKPGVQPRPRSSPASSSSPGLSQTSTTWPACGAKQMGTCVYTSEWSRHPSPNRSDPP
jgi:hypothetical protein